MVVTRKAPIAPPTSSSRAISSISVPRTGKGKPAANGSAEVDSTGASFVPEPVGLKALDISDEKGQKSKSKNKKAAKKQRKARNSFLALIRDILFSVLLIYSLFVCSPDKPITPDSHPICRALSTTHHRLVEPYILTPLRPVLEHPSVAPYIQRVEPYRQRVITTGELVIDRTRTQWIRYVIPQWNKRVVPEWNKQVVPELRKLEQKVGPYRAQVEREYQRVLTPRIRLIQYNVERWYRLSQPYFILAAQKVQTGYEAAKPYAIPVWQRFRQIVIQLNTLVQEQRRKFVDPHIITLWEKVTELSRGQAQQIKPRTHTAVSNTHGLESSLISGVITASSSVSGTLSSASMDMESIASSLVSSRETEVSVDTSLASALGTVAEAEVPTTFSSIASASAWSSATETATETLSTVASVIADHAEDASSSVSSLLNEATSTVEYIFADVTGPSQAISVVPQPPSTPGDEDLDLNEFIESLGNLEADEEVELVPEETEPDDIFASMPTPSETAEEKEARLAAVAEKRRNIVARHEKFEQDLEALIKQKKKELRKALVALRKAAVTELKASKEIREEVEGLVEEAEKFLKGADGYLKTLKKENRPTQDKERLWGKVLDRVEKRFEEGIEKVASFVNEWHGTVLYREVQEVNDVAETVKDLAERAQADIGMDYAWLDDVDYYDWVRYHDLLRASENFTEQAFMIQNGTHPSPPINPVIPALNDLEAEINDIVTGFQTRIRGLKRSGIRAFGGESSDVDETDSHDSEDNSTAPTKPQSPPIPEVSILPVPDSDTETDEALRDGDALPVIGRSKQEIVDAMARAEAQEQPEAEFSAKVDLQYATPEEVVEGPVQDVETEERPTAPPSVVVVHEEL